jgi:hypothetical protein
MAHALLPTKYMTRQQIYNYTGWAFTRVYLHPVRLARNILSPNDWRRHWWREMVGYVVKQLVRSAGVPGLASFARNLVPRF